MTLTTHINTLLHDFYHFFFIRLFRDDFFDYFYHFCSSCFVGRSEMTPTIFLSVAFRSLASIGVLNELAVVRQPTKDGKAGKNSTFDGVLAHISVARGETEITDSDRGSCCAFGRSVLQSKAKCDSLQSDLKVEAKPPSDGDPERTLEEAVAAELKAQTGQPLMVLSEQDTGAKCDLERDAYESGYDIHGACLRGNATCDAQWRP